MSAYRIILALFLPAVLGAQNVATVTILAEVDSVSVTIDPLVWSGRQGDTITFACVVRNETTGAVVDRPCVFRSSHPRIQVDSLTGFTTLLRRVPQEETGLVVADTVPATSPPIGDTLFYDGFVSGSTASPVGGEWYALVANPNGDVPFVSAGVLRFTHAATASGADSNSEARFSADVAASELWLKWRELIPANYAHRNDSPANNKFWIIGYANTLHGGWSEPGGWTVRMELSPATAPGNISRSRLVYGTEESGFSSEDANGTGPSMQQFDALVTDADRGAWVTYMVHLRLATSIADSDGALDFFKDCVLVIANSGMPIGGTLGSSPADSYELVGWANSGYDAETVFDVDDVGVYGSDPGCAA